jgi:thiol-disulfide isomerase/thioredoxin
LWNAEEVEVDSSFWAIVGETLDGQPLMLNQYRSGWTLLIFWGEWCAPCLQEIPALRQIAAAMPAVRIVGFLNTHDIAKARRVIAAERMNWPQVLLSPPLAKQFRISAYPTTLLLLPGGARAIRLHAVNTDVLTRVMER